MSIRPPPSSTLTLSPLLPSNALPSIVPVKSIVIAVAVAALAIHGHELRTLCAQILDHRIDVGVSDLGGRSRHCQPVDLLELDLREHLEDGAVLEVLARRGSDRLDARAGGRAQLLLVDRLGKARLHEVGQHFLAHLCTELLADDLERHLARTEALELGRAADALQALVDGLLDPFATGR